MFSTSVIIHDYVVGRLSTLVLPSEIHERVRAVWDKSDRLIAEMQHTSLFKGKVLWRDLDPVHFRVMLALNLAYHAELSNSERANVENAISQSLYFIICALIHCMEERTDTFIDLMRIYRIDETTITYDISARLRPVILSDETETRPTFRVVADNS